MTPGSLRRLNSATSRNLETSWWLETAAPFFFTLCSMTRRLRIASSNVYKNQFGVPGMIDADWQRGAGKGTHATLSRFDMHNTLITAGPDFRRGQVTDLASGNVDLAPTILRIFRITSPQSASGGDGRILSEAMVKADPVTAELKPETKTIEATKDFPAGTWRQSLQISRVGSTEYLDQGSGVFVPKK